MKRFDNRENVETLMIAAAAHVHGMCVVRAWYPRWAPGVGGVGWGGNTVCTLQIALHAASHPLLPWAQSLAFEIRPASNAVVATCAGKEEGTVVHLLGT